MKKTVFGTDKNNLILLSLAKLLSGFAGYIYDVGIIIYLYEQTQSVAVVGGFFISQLLPAFIILLSGKLIDKYNKKNLIIYTNAAKSAVFLLLLLNRNIWNIYILTFLFNFLLEFEGNTFHSLMANIFPKERIFKSASFINLLNSISMVIAPVIASLIALHFSFDANLILDIFLFMITALIYSLVSTSSQHTVVNQSSTAGGKGSIRIFKNKSILSTVVFWNIFMLCIGVTAPLEISIIEDTLKMPSLYYGIGNTVEGIGMLTASVFILGIIKKLKPTSIILIGLFSAAFSYMVIGISGNIWIYFIGAFLVGMTSAFCPLGFKTEIQMNSDPSVIGRTFTTARFTVILSRIAGSFIVGVILNSLGIRQLYFGIAALLFLTAFLYMRKAII